MQELEARDREVRAHEAAHLAAAGGLAMGGANFSLQRGPDGRMYAVGGEVSIDVSEGRTPEETIARAERIRAAALAPAEPSAKDMQVAARATRMAARNRSSRAVCSGQTRHSSHRISSSRSTSSGLRSSPRLQTTSGWRAGIGVRDDASQDNVGANAANSGGGAIVC